MSTTYATTTDRAAEIRQALKSRYGWTSRDVSVKADYYSMGSSIRIRIKSPVVPSVAVEAIAQGHESIDRDQWGEILSGGNRFVFVNYDGDTLRVIGGQYLGPVNAAIERRATYSDNTLEDVLGTPYRIGLGSNGWGFSLWGDSGHIAEYNSAEGLAEGIGVAMLNHKFQQRQQLASWGVTDKKAVR